MQITETLTTETLTTEALKWDAFKASLGRKPTHPVNGFC